MPIDLSEVPVGDLMAEVKRRLECQDKPERRVILIGERLQGARGVRGCARSSSEGGLRLPGGATPGRSAPRDVVCRASRLREGHAVAHHQEGQLPLPPGHG